MDIRAVDQNRLVHNLLLILIQKRKFNYLPVNRMIFKTSVMNAK